MQSARVIGHATATIKHASMQGWKLLIAQPLGVADRADGEPVLVIDGMGAGRGSKVIITSDGKAVSQMLGDDHSPVRWAVIGIEDDPTGRTQGTTE